MKLLPLRLRVIRLPRLTHPAQAVVLGFAAAVVLGSGLLMLPISRAGPGGASAVESLFTATSSVCVTGLVVVDTPTYWTHFGQAVILTLIQVGGFGIMTVASVLGLLVARKLGLRTRLTAAAETKTLGLGDIKSVLFGVVRVSLLFEVFTAVALTVRWGTHYDEPLPSALWLGVFHAVSAFNNAGFALFPDSLIGFATDPWICLPICVSVVAGGLGFPVLLELRRALGKPKNWTLHTKIVLFMTVLLLLGGTLLLTALEWGNQATLGQYDGPGRLLVGVTQGVMPRTAGFNSVDTGQMHPATWLGTDILMFIGGGPAGTAGGIKVTTFAVLAMIMYNEVRGEVSVNIYDRRLPRSMLRQALTIALLSVGAVVIGTFVLLLMSPFRLDEVLFEVVSAFATVGLSTGITPDLADPARLLLVVLMFTGRLGPVTLASALALRRRRRLFELPEERPLIG